MNIVELAGVAKESAGGVVALRGVDLMIAVQAATTELLGAEAARP